MKTHLQGENQSTRCGTHSTAVTVADVSEVTCRACLRIDRHWKRAEESKANPARLTDSEAGTALGSARERLLSEQEKKNATHSELPTAMSEVREVQLRSDDELQRGSALQAQQESGGQSHQGVQGLKDQVASLSSQLAGLRELPEWLDMFREVLEDNQRCADLYMQEVTGLGEWAAIVRAALHAAQAPQDKCTCSPNRRAEGWVNIQCDVHGGLAAKTPEKPTE